MEDTYNILYIIFTVLGVIFLSIYGEAKHKKIRKLLILFGILAVIISYVFNTYKEKENVISFNKIIDTLRQDNKNLFIALSFNDSSRQVNFNTVSHLYKKYFHLSKITPPEIISIKPIIYIDKNYIPADDEMPAASKLGIYFILNFKNGSEPKTVNKIKIRCKLILDYSLYLNFDEVTNNKHVGTNRSEFKNKKPYINIDWDSYVSPKTISKHFYPFEQGLIGFVLLEPTTNGQPESGWKCPKTQYLGYEDGSLTPLTPRKYPDFTLLFSDYQDLQPKKIRNDFIFYLVLDSVEYLIDRNKFLPVDRVSKHEWENDSFEKMFYRYYAE